MSYEFEYAIENFMHALGPLEAILSAFNSFGSIISLAAYILGSLGLYTFARRRGINHAWLSWIPIGNVWILGSLSDQYQYLVKGKNKSKRKSLLILNIVNAVLIMIMVIVIIALVVNTVLTGMETGMDDYAAMEFGFKLIAAIFGTMIPVIGVGIASTIIGYIALYDVFMSADANSGVVFLVLSIFFNFLAAIFLFVDREKDLGMPPRRPEFVPGACNPQYQQPQYNTQYQQNPTSAQGTFTQEAPRQEPGDPWEQQQ